MAREDKDIIDRSLIDRLAGTRLAVIGDSMVDRFLWGSVDRISPEAPVPVVKLKRETVKLGGAANVAANIRALGAEAVGTDEIYDVEADVFAPCALGAVINEETIPRLKCKIVAGPANNQLANNEAGNELEKRGILYAPDYAVNAGGLMNVSIEFEGWNHERAIRMTRTIYYNVGKIFKIADRDGIPTWQAADRMAEERIATLGQLKMPFMGRPHKFPGRNRH